MTDSLGIMNSVRVRQGREPINPFTIEGFGDGDAPPPPMADLPEPFNTSGPGEVELGDTFTPPSPLVPSQYLPQPAPMPIAPALMVADGQAMFRGASVELDTHDQKAIATIILRAAQRRFSAQLLELTGKRTRQRRAEPSGEVVPANPAAPRVKRKYVRKAKPDGAATSGGPGAA